MTEIITTSSQLRSKAEELGSINAKFKTQVDQLESTESALVAMWEGDSKEAFHNAFNSDKVQMHNFYNAISQYVNALNQIAANYDNAEKANVEVGTTRTYKG